MNILVVEDEIMAARHLCRVLREILQEKIQSLHHVDTLDDAQQYLQSHGIDLLFLDLNLSGEDGFELLSDVVSSNFQTIIVSGNIDQALRSYEYGVLDFVPKSETSVRVTFGVGVRGTWIFSPSIESRITNLGSDFQRSTLMMGADETRWIH